MTTSNYELTHPDYDHVAPNYARNMALYDGGESMDSAGAARRFLTQHTWEKDAQYDIRIKRAAYRNYAAPTVDLFASSITDGVKREGVDSITQLAPLLDNCDRQGTSPDAFFKAVDTGAASVGASFVLVDMPKAATPASNLREAKQFGLSPYFIHIPALDVIAWDFDDSGELSAVKIKGRHMRAEDGLFSRYVEIKTVTVWTKKEWKRFKSVDGKSFVEDGEGVHAAGVVPIVPFLYESSRRHPMTGRSVIDDVASLIERVYNQDSELDKMLFDAAIPLLVAYGLTQDEGEAVVRATSALWRFGNAETRLEYVEPSGNAFSAKRQQILDDVESIREISLRQTKPKGSGVESAEAKRLDSVQISSQLADFARSMAASERRCWEIAATLAGVDASTFDGVEIQYNETFDPEAMREKMIALFRELRRDTDISRETLFEELGWDEKRRKVELERLAKEQANDAATFTPSFGR